METLGYNTEAFLLSNLKARVTSINDVAMGDNRVVSYSERSYIKS